MSFPFLYFGHAPSDWYEGANLGHIVEVMLVSPPTAGQREQMALLFERHFAQGPAEISPNQPWFWAEKYFCFSFGERWINAGRSAFSALTDFLLELHRFAPIVEVQLWSAREPGDSRWHSWTMSRQSWPSPRPVYSFEPANLIFPAKRDSALGKYAADPAFEQMRQMARQTQTLANVANVEGPLKMVHLDKLELRLANNEELDSFDKPDPNLRHRKPPVMHGDYVQKFAGRVWAWRYENSTRVAFLYLDDNGKKISLRPEDQMSPVDFAVHLHGPFLHGSGCFAYFRLPHAVFELDFATGAFTRRFSSPDSEIIQALQWLGGDTWGMLSARNLMLIDTSSEQPSVLSKVAVRRLRLQAAKNKLLVASAWSDKPIFFGAVNGQLKKLATMDVKAHFVDSDGESIYITKDSLHFRVEGWERLVDEFAAALTAKAAKKVQSKKR